MELKFLKAGTGDSILIHHKKHNILVDGGNDAQFLISEIHKINNKNEVIDLLIITHHDSDHIKGIIQLLNNINENNLIDNSKFIKKVVFNSPRKILGNIEINDSNELSYRQAFDVEQLLLKMEIGWDVFTDESEPLSFEDLKINFLSPTKPDLEKYSTDKGAYLTGDFKCDWKSPMFILEKDIDDDSQDTSPSNRTSIVLHLESDDKSVLLTGDITPDRLNVILDKLVKENGNEPIDFDLVKLPHHGSYRSISKKIIEKIKCHNYVISTNSKSNFLPNKRTLLKILKYSDRSDRRPIAFFFNYTETVNNLGITSQDEKTYNMILTPNNEPYGISIG